VPLTVPAHQVLVAPLVRARGGALPGSALMLGAALPDLAFLVGGYPASGPAHEWYGPLVFAPTLGILLYIWCERVLAPALGRALPDPWARLFATRGLPRDARGWAWALAALTIGAATHVALDGFTHPWLWPARVLYADRYAGPFRVTRLLQNTISIAASIAVIVWARRRARSCPPVAIDPRWRATLARGAALVLACALVGLALWLAVRGWPVTRHDVTILVAPACDLALIGVTVAQLRFATARC
jgi:hypothetical protein